MQHWQQMEETVLCAGVKRAPQKKKKAGGLADVRRVCSRLTPAGFFVACDICEAKLSFSDGLCGWFLTLNPYTS